MKIRHWLFALFLARLLVTGAYAQETSELLSMSLDDLLNLEVSSAGFFKMDKTKSPGYVFVFDQKRIDESAARSMHELLDMYAPGVSIGYHFLGSEIGQRGITIDNNAKTLYMVDGENLNARFHMGYMFPYDVPLMGEIDRVEVVQGPGGIQFGSGAINGVINTITKTGKDHQGFNVKTSYGPVDDLVQTEFSYGKKYENGDLFLYAGALGASGFSPDPNSIAFANNDGSRSDSNILAANGGFQVKKFVDDNFKLVANWNWGNFNLLGQFATYHGTSYTNAFNIYQQTKSSNGTDILYPDQAMTAVWSQTYLLLSPKYTFEFNPTDSLDVAFTLFATDIGMYDFRRNQLFETWGQNEINEKEYAFKTTFKTTRLNKNALAVGLSLAQRDFNYMKPIFGRQAPVNSGTFVGNQGGLTPAANFFGWMEYALFFEDVISITDDLNLSVGAREEGVAYDRNVIGQYGMNFGATVATLPQGLPAVHYHKFVPRVSVAYDITDTATAKIIYQEGFRHPDVANIINPYDVNSPVGPESMKTVSANYFQSLTIFSRPTSIEANLYYNYLQNTIGWRQAQAGNQSGFANTPESYASIGTELMFKVEPFNAANWNLSYSYSQPVNFSESLQNSDYGRVMEVNENRNAWVRYPKHMIKTDYGQWFFSKLLLAHMAIRYSSAFPDIYSNGAVTQTRVAFKGARVQLDIMIRYMLNSLAKDASLSFYVKNLTGDQNGIPPWSGDADGTAGIDARLYYLTLNVPF